MTKIIIRRVCTKDHAGWRRSLKIFINGRMHSELKQDEYCEFETESPSITIRVKESMWSRERSFRVKENLVIECGSDFQASEILMTGLLDIYKFITIPWKYLFSKKRFLYLREFEENDRNYFFRKENREDEDEEGSWFFGFMGGLLLASGIIGEWLPGIIIGVIMLILQLLIIFVDVDDEE